MYDIERQLNNLPKGKLSKRADLMIRFRLWRASLFGGFALPLAGRAQLPLASSYTAAPWRFGLLKPVMAALLAVFVISASGLSAYAYSSDQVTMASGLYPLKRGLENLEGYFATTPLAEVEYHTKIAARRLAEADVLSQAAATSSEGSEGSIRSEVTALPHEREFNATIREAEDEIDKANGTADRITEQKVLNQALNHLSATHLKDAEKIKKMAREIGLAADDETTDNVALIFEDVKDHQQRVIERLSQVGSARLPEADDAATTTAAETDGATTTAEQAAKTLDEMKSEVSDMEETLAGRPNLPAKQVEKLSAKLRKKLGEAEQAMKDGNFNKFDGLIRATEALTNNGKHFIKEEPDETREIKGDKIKNRNRPRIPSPGGYETGTATTTKEQAQNKPEQEPATVQGTGSTTGAERIERQDRNNGQPATTSETVSNGTETD